MLQYEGATVKGYDPVAMPAAAKENPQILLAEDAYELAVDMDAMVVCTEWNEFKQLDLERVRSSMRRPVVVDGRNIYDPHTMQKLGFTYRAVGRGATFENGGA
jgi:UDPglucose 6-dehydrogenase